MLGRTDRAPRERLDLGIGRLERAAARLARSADVDHARFADALITTLAPDGGFEDDVVVACLAYSPPSSRFEQAIRAEPAELAALRRAVQRWLDHTAVDHDAAADVLLTLGEACSNAVEHAYPSGAPGRIGVTLTRHHSHVALRIRDEGSWRPPAPGTRRRGRGTLIMRSVSSQFSRTSDASGTVVAMTVPAGAV